MSWFFSVSDMDVCFDEVVVVWCGGRAGKGRVEGGIGGGGGGGWERRGRKKSE